MGKYIYYIWYSQYTHCIHLHSFPIFPSVGYEWLRHYHPTVTLPSAASSLETVAPPEFPLPAEWLERPRWHPPGIKTLVPCCVESYWILLDKLWKVAGQLLDTLCWDANLLETKLTATLNQVTLKIIETPSPASAYQLHRALSCCGNTIEPQLNIPSGKHTNNYGKSPFFMGKSTISMVIFNGKLLNYRKVTQPQQMVKPSLWKQSNVIIRGRQNTSTNCQGRPNLLRFQLRGLGELCCDQGQNTAQVGRNSKSDGYLCKFTGNP